MRVIQQQQGSFTWKRGCGQVFARGHLCALIAVILTSAVAAVASCWPLATAAVASTSPQRQASTSPHPQPAPTTPHPQAAPHTTYIAPVTSAPTHVYVPTTQTPITTTPAVVPVPVTTSTASSHRTRLPRSAHRKAHRRVRRTHAGSRATARHGSSAPHTPAVAGTLAATTLSHSSVGRSTAAVSTGSSGGFPILVVVGLTLLGLALAVAPRLLPGSRVAMAADAQRATMPEDSRFGPARRIRAAIAGIQGEEITVVIVAVVLAILVGLLAGRV